MPDFSKARDPLDVLDMMAAPTRAYSEGAAAANETRRRLYLDGLEDAAQMAEQHKGRARAERLARERHRPPRTDPQALAEILAEERGEDIAADIIAKAIRDKIAMFPEAP